MAVDLSIQLFAYELFNNLWIMNGEKPRSFSASTIPESSIVESHFKSEIADAIDCRRIIFREAYITKFEFANIACYDGPSDFFALLVNAFSDAIFKELKVFDRIIATCGFVMEMSLYCYRKGNKSFLKYDFLCWAMYFDTELKSAFYERGGWTVLKVVAKSYELPLLALNTLRNKPHFLEDFPKFTTSVQDFIYFQKFQDQGNQTCAKSWVNFHLGNAKNRRVNTCEPIVVEVLEEFFTAFRFLCDPLGKRVFEGDDGRQNKTIYEKCKGNDYLEKLAMKLSHCHISYPTKQNCDFQDGLEISPSPEIYLRQIHAEQALTMQKQDLEIQRLSKLVGTLKAENSSFQTNNLSNESPVNKTNNLSKNDKLEDQDNGLRTQDMETISSLNNDTAIDQDRRQQPLDIETNNCLNNDLPVDQDQKPQTEKTETNNLLKDSTSVNQNLKESLDRYMGRLAAYEARKCSWNLNRNATMLNRVPVCAEEHFINNIENEFVSNKTRVKENSNACVAKNETSQIIQAASLEGREIQNGTKKKKKRKTKSGKSAPNLCTENTVKLDADTDDTKDILRMVLVLGTQPGVDYILSTLRQDYKTSV